MIVNKKTLKTEEVINLNKISKKKHQLGWCRGIEVIDHNAYVGFSSIRQSNFVEYGKWIMNGKKLPARIAQYDLVKKELKKEIEISNKGAAIFMIRKTQTDFEGFTQESLNSIKNSNILNTSGDKVEYSKI